MTAVATQPPLLGDQLERDLALLGRALGHPARIRILRLLLDRDSCCCGQIVDELPLAQATVSQHLKVLKGAGLVTGEIDGPRTCYCANRDRLGDLHTFVGAMLAEASDLSAEGLRGCD